MATWRVQLKPDSAKGISYKDLLEFCKSNQIIGVGWYLVEGHTDDYATLRNEVYAIEAYKGGESSALRAVNAIREMKPGDLVWTRVGGDASEYYLCRVGDLLWKDRVVTDEHRRHDIGNFVSAKWVKIGKEERVPGKVVNSFCASRSAQHVSEVDEISKMIWNTFSEPQDEKYELPALDMSAFWNMIGSEELECLVFLYLQSKGYYIYSSTLKLSTAKFEAVLTYRDGSHLAYPQVKRNVALHVEDYISSLANAEDKVFLFTTSEDYGQKTHSQILCISREELESFMKNNSKILPNTITYWLEILHD